MNFSKSDNPISLTLVAFLTSSIVFLPIVSVLFISLGSSSGLWIHLFETSLFLYLKTTFLLILGVAIVVLLLGVSTAWLVTMCTFPGKFFFEWLLLLPLAFPTYIIAYAYTDFFDYSGQFQTFLRFIFEWTEPVDYWFPEIRSLGGAIIVMGLVLYPYVYILARSSFLEQSVNVIEISKVLGKSPLESFIKVSLPIARPSIIVGLSLALMETLNDFGAVDFFAVPTLTQAVVDVWLGMGNFRGGAQIASLVLIFVATIIFFEKSSRAKIQIYQQTSSRMKKIPSYNLKGKKAIFAICVCIIPIFLGFLLPFLILLNLSVDYFDYSRNNLSITRTFNSLSISFIASFFVTLIAILLVYFSRLNKNYISQLFVNISSLGYAIPGAVLAIGVIIPVTKFENLLDEFLTNFANISTGLFFSGSIFILIFAFMVRFMVIPIGQVETSLRKIPESIDMVSRTLGYKFYEILRKFHFPLLKGSILTGFLLVFVDCMKELPMTLLLRPFNFETLSTHVYQYASDEMLGEASFSCVLIVLTGIIPIIILTTMIRNSRNNDRI